LGKFSPKSKKNFFSPTSRRIFLFFQNYYLATIGPGHNRVKVDENVLDAQTAMAIALDTLGPALDAGLAAVRSLFCESVKELKMMIQRKPVYVNHVDIWFLRSMDPLSRDPLKLRPLLKSLVRLPRPAAAAAYIHCQELLDSLGKAHEYLVFRC